MLLHESAHALLTTISNYQTKQYNKDIVKQGPHGRHLRDGLMGGPSESACNGSLGTLAAIRTFQNDSNCPIRILLASCCTDQDVEHPKNQDATRGALPPGPPFFSSQRTVAPAPPARANGRAEDPFPHAFLDFLGFVSGVYKPWEVSHFCFSLNFTSNAVRIMSGDVFVALRHDHIYKKIHVCKEH